STIAALFYIEQNVLLIQGHEQSRQLGHRIVAELGQRVASTEAITKNLAQLGELLDKDPDQFKKIVPHIINFSGDSKIAGGGIWPEPFTFDPKLERRSFFWGREDDGSLKYFNDYNDMEGPGYHNEEWYVPARYLKKNQVYWSKSYMDPYSYEPMVTCTAPMFIGDKFSGVSTIDIKLTGLDEFFKEKVVDTGGYIFAVDRNNKLLSFPDKTSAKIFTKTEEGKTSEEFMNISELSKKFSGLSPLEEQLNSINLEVFSKEAEKSKITDLSKKIATESYQVNEREGEIIAAYINGKISESEKKIQLTTDPVLNKQVLLYTFVMPSTGWKVIVVTPLEKVNAIAREVTLHILKFVIVVELVILLFMLLVTSKIITQPLASMSQKLNEVSEDDLEDITLSEESRPDEIGHLAFEINKRSAAIKDAFKKLKESNLDLEDRVTERTKEIEEALLQVEEAKTKAENANQSKSNFLANMSHEIRTPMNAILGYTDLLYKEIVDPKLKNYIITIKNSGQSLLTLINDILDLSKVEAGKIELQEKAVKVEPLFKSVMDQFVDIAVRKNIHLRLNTNSEIPHTLTLDDNRVRQILINLVGNAVKFTRKGEVSINILRYTEDKTLAFSVKDSGSGIPANKLEQIFENFEQVDNEDAKSGTGLGLAITKRLVEVMNGSISINSVFGEGSEFIVELRDVQESDIEEAKSTKNESENIESYSFQKAKILIADDIQTNRELIASYLENHPFEIIFANDGQEAIDIAISIKPDLILMDMKMPNVDGYTATKHIKENEETKKIPVIAITAAAMKTSEKEIRNVCDAYLKKPITESELLNELIKFLPAKVSKKAAPIAENTSQETAQNILSIFSNKLSNEILAISERREITELHELVDRLNKISIDNPSHILKPWVESINNALNDFDMELVQAQLNAVVDTICKIEEINKEKVS
ncbi:MAG: ATP-binding protein, partial [Lentisphaeraceae bacterium]|nr:ATP-binding protein [Lentisphaeraceae bacterium]